jgi:hypothetical protein
MFLKSRPGGVQDIHHLWDNVRGCVLSEGEIKVSDKVTLRGSISFMCPSCWMRVLRCCFGLVVLGL